MLGLRAAGAASGNHSNAARRTCSAIPPFLYRDRPVAGKKIPAGGADDGHVNCLHLVGTLHGKEAESVLWCLQCHRSVIECTCPDIEERLADLAAHPTLAPAALQNLGARRLEEIRASREQTEAKKILVH